MDRWFDFNVSFPHIIVSTVVTGKLLENGEVQFRRNLKTNQMAELAEKKLMHDRDCPCEVLSTSRSNLNFYFFCLLISMSKCILFHTFKYLHNLSPQHFLSSFHACTMYSVDSLRSSIGTVYLSSCSQDPYAHTGGDMEYSS